MGCVNSKKTGEADTVSPVGPYVYSSSSRKRSNGSGRSMVVETSPSSRGNSGVVVNVTHQQQHQGDLKPAEWKKGDLNVKIGFYHRFVEGEQIAAGWPSWLTSVAGEAIHGLVPLKTDSFEKLDKVGQGTYSSVFKAREVETGRMVALKKVRMDTLQPESIRFMAREIIILRTLDHPNIMKLEGIITSPLSNSIYLVFEYMEHDLAGLVSNPDIKFTDAQIKCYMRQLLSGIEHCHLRGIMHRDIKVSNILVNNEGILKIGDFGLANNTGPNSKRPLTSRVVTLWYRPPELLMGSTNYGVTVDLWSIGCVFAELFIGKPILKGRTEVEQLHKIFKLCGSPPEHFWKRSKLPLATMFKPQTSYESSLSERCKGHLPPTAVDLLETLLAVDPSKRGTASSALMSEYFNTAPYACSPSLLPKYLPSKELDAKNREDMLSINLALRKKNGGGKVREREALTSGRQRRAHKVIQDHNNVNKPTMKENISQNPRRDDDGKEHQTKGRVGAMHKEQQRHLYDAKSDNVQRLNGYNGYSVYSGPAPVSGSSGFTWAKRRKPDASSVLSDGSRSKISALDPTFAKGTYDLTKQGIEVSERKYHYNTRHHDEIPKHAVPKHLGHKVESFDAADVYNANYFMDLDLIDKSDNQIDAQDDKYYGEPVEQSVPTNKNDELLHWHENNMWRQSVRKSRLGRGMEE
ncbi:probable serine/threonine-protein kinase At1g54610 isoform X2 [Trifolium pratense]|uniref:probable serine/threonine-protein kinase At1g54610 isoform X2 n=1 Tax=Trifolium pratense TaxID=57577 RepID=UPI001E6933E5|nr:probable serine/threonine-protein kinase At1g54610 isoform X2 [Trifolium pratense]